MNYSIKYGNESFLVMNRNKKNQFDRECIVYIICLVNLMKNKGKTDHPLAFFCVLCTLLFVSRLIGSVWFTIILKQGKMILRYLSWFIRLSVNHASNIKFTCRTDNNTDLVFQVNSNCKTKKTDQEQCWSKKSNWSKKLDRKEESIPSCSSSRRNSVVAVVADPFHPSYCSWTGD